MLQYPVHEAVERFVFFRRGAGAFGFRLNKRARGEFGSGVLDQGAGGLGCGFQMELKADGASGLEGLVFAGRAAGQMDGVRGQVEGFAVRPDLHPGGHGEG